MTTKVTTTENYEDAQGKHIVKRGRLVLLRNEDIYPEDGMIGSNNVFPLFMWTHLHTNAIKNNTFVEYVNTALIQPIIISDEQQSDLNAGDSILFTYHNGNQEICKYVEDDGYGMGVISFNGERMTIRYSSTCRIIALPQHFSPKHLQAIVDGKIKDGDEVLVECENFKTNNHLYPHSSNKEFDDNFIIKLNQSNHIKLFRVDKDDNLLSDILAVTEIQEKKLNSLIHQLPTGELRNLATDINMCNKAILLGIKTALKIQK